MVLLAPVPASSAVACGSNCVCPVADGVRHLLVRTTTAWSSSISVLPHFRHVLVCWHDSVG